MEISFQRFAQLTALIAAGGSIAVACTVNNVENNPAPEGGTSGIAGSGGSTAPTAGTKSTTGGTTSAAGASASAGSPGAAGTPAATGGTSEIAAAGTTATAAGSPSAAGAANVAGATATTTTAGQPSVVGGASNAGSAGQSSTTVAAGAGGTTSAAAGAPSVAGATGVAGSNSGTCVASDPAAEGYGYDCSTLPYYAEECPDPTGEGYASPAGVNVCQWYSNGRTASVKILTDCLDALTKPTEGWCGAAHESQVAACEAQMAQQTCASTVAQSACANYKTQCSGLSESACVGKLSALSDDEVVYIDNPCMESVGLLPHACDAKLNACTTRIDHSVSVTTACTALKADCSAIDPTSCETALDMYSTGMTSALRYQVDIPVCIASYMQFYGYTCGEAAGYCL